MASVKTVLHITPFFSPNIGGVETHLNDLIEQLDQHQHHNIVLTYSPLTTNIPWKPTEKIGHNSFVYRFYWPGKNLFHRLEKFPLLNFLYITPYLLIRSFLFLAFSQIKIDTIHSYGLNSALIGNILKAIFHIPRHVTSVYSTYDNTPFNSLFVKLLIYTLNHTDAVLTQSDSSLVQLQQLGVKHAVRYYHWVDLNRFRPKTIKPKGFSVLFVGRMIPQKNVLLLAKIAKRLPRLHFTLVGTGPDFNKIPKLRNITLVGDVSYSNLHSYYQSSSVLCVPSKYHEGWGRIIAESIACGTPVISSNLGGTIEAADNTVAIFVKPTSKNFFDYVQRLFTHPDIYNQLKNSCRPYALKHYSSKNISYIIRQY